MIGTRTVVMLSLLTGIGLEVGIHALSGRREAWDASQYWTVGLPLAAVAAAAIGYLARQRDWTWTCLIVPAQVTTMMARNGELGALWPLAAALSAILSAPFVLAAFIGSRFRPQG